MSAFCRDSRLVLSKKYVATPVFFVDSNSPRNDLLFPRGPTLAQNPLNLLGTALNGVGLGLV